jgi:translocation and assembly module TamB
MDPLLQLTAVHEVVQPGRDPLEILITVGGRLKAPVVTLSSDAQPPLPQTDLLSYLVFGTSSGSLMQRGGSGLAGSGAAQVGALAAQQLSSVVVGTLFEEALADIEARSGRFGLDVLRITAAELPEELAFDTYFQNVLRGTQIEAGKYVTPRLFVAARGRTTTEALPGLRSEYRTQSGFRWTAAWEPRYLPLLPAFGSGGTAEQTRALSTFLFWKWRF